MRKKLSSIVFAEEIKIVHNSTKQRNILQASEIKFMRGSPKLLVTKNISAEKKIPPPPHPQIKNIIFIPDHFLANGYNSCTGF